MSTGRRSASSFGSAVRRVFAPYAAGVFVGGAVVWTTLTLLRPATPVVPARPDPRTTPPAAYAWSDQPEAAFPIPPYARFLEGVRVVIDPGHVGQRDPGGTWKRGPTGLREAEVNLRVAQFLREFLLAAGADVVLTREVDESLDLPDADDLRQRAAVANERDVDLLLSIHHNAVDNPDANYTSLFYHLSPTHSLAGLCAARHLLTGLNDALRLDTHIACPVLNDRVQTRNGFAVLREARVPAVLSEASFHSNPREEARLRDPLYNRREAYGLFLGLARWAQAGLPRVALASPADGNVRPGDTVTISLQDGLGARGGWGADRVRILPDSVVVRVNGEVVSHQFDGDRAELRVPLPRRLRGRECTLWVDFENVFGQHVLHPQIELSVGG